MMSRKARPTLLPLLLLAALSFLLPGAWGEAAAQDVVSPEPVGEVSVEGEPVSPGGAFLRSLVLPGWGHASVGSGTRAAFYAAAQSGTALMVLKSASRQRTARRFAAEERRLVEDELRLQGVTSADSLRVLAGADPRVSQREELVDRRGQQVEDWVALGLFLTLLGAADAYVAGHLADFPEPLALDVGRRPGDMAWEITLRIRHRGPAGR